MLNENRQIRFQRLTHADLSMLHEWINRAHVAAWWDTNVLLEDVEAEYTPGLVDDTGVQHFIAYDEARAIGFIQSYVAAHAGDGWWPAETILASTASTNVWRTRVR